MSARTPRHPRDMERVYVLLWRGAILGVFSTWDAAEAGKAHWVSHNGERYTDATIYDCAAQ
jgi:hypothetical protein